MGDDAGGCNSASDTSVGLIAPRARDCDRVRALADSDWFKATRARLGKDHGRLDGLLLGAGWLIIGGTRLFRLAAHADAGAVFERGSSPGILALPPSPASGDGCDSGFRAMLRGKGWPRR
jgi:hypothetical protein